MTLVEANVCHCQVNYFYCLEMVLGRNVFLVERNQIKIV